MTLHSSEKWCKHGQHYVDHGGFNKDNKAGDGLQTHCKECKKLIRAESLAKKTLLEIKWEGDKYCKYCRITKPRTDFCEDRRNADLLNNKCKACDSVTNKAWRDNAPRNENPDYTSTKTCTKCKLTKVSIEFNRDSLRKDGLFPWCIVCHRVSVMENYKTHKQDYINRALLWNKEHPERVAVIHSQWKKNNPHKVNTWAAQRRFNATLGMSDHDKQLSAVRRYRIRNNPCYYCGMHKDIMHVDHYIPLARGGTDHFWNLVNSCSADNQSKGIMTGDEYVEKLKLSPPA